MAAARNNLYGSVFQRSHSMKSWHPFWLKRASAARRFSSDGNLSTQLKRGALATAMVFAGVSGGCGTNSNGSPGTGGTAGAGAGGRAGSGVGGGAGTFAGAGNGGSLGAGGSPASGGSSGSVGSCDGATACGGDVVGTWTVMSSCLDVGGELDLSLFGAGCLSAPVTGSLQVTGTWTAKQDGSYLDETITSGSEQFTLAPSCLIISSAPVTCEGAANLLVNAGYSSLTCTDADGGGCNCSGTVHQNGGLGVVSFAPSTGGNYTTANNTITITGDSGDTKHSYCVSGNTMTWTPQSTKPTTSGTIVLAKVEVSGAGGAGGMGAGGMGAGGMGAGGMGAGGMGAGGMGAGGMGAGGMGAGGMGAGAAGMAGMAGAAGGGSEEPCDIYQAAGNPCVAAHSTTRALFGAYNGKLYQVRNSGGMTKDILTLAPGGIADGVSQDEFCSGTTCVITAVYDQSGNGNDLWYQGSTQVPGSPQSSPAKATTESLNVGGHKVYSLYINPGNSYWVDASTSGIATGNEPEGMYMVTSGKHYNSGCCFDYGNSETDRNADGAGTMDALNLSSITAWGTGAGSGPWVLADLEYGLFSQGSSGKNQNDPSQTSTYVTAVLKNNGTTEYSLRGGDAAAGALSTYYKGGLPGGWSPMKKQGAIVLGSGGDCCKPSGGANLSDGTFYEGCIVTGYPSDATEDKVQANVVAAGYGK